MSGSVVHFSPLTRGVGVGNLASARDNKVHVVLEAEDYHSYTSNQLNSVRSEPNEWIGSSRAQRELSLPKTFTTRKGALLLFSEDIVGKEKDGEANNDKLSDEQGFVFKTVDDLSKSILHYGSRDPIAEDVYLQFVRDQKLSRKFRPGFSARRYLSRLARSFDDAFMQSLLSKGYMCEKNMFQSWEVAPNLKHRIDDNISQMPVPYRLVRSMLQAPGILSGFDFFKSFTISSELTAVTEEEGVTTVDKQQLPLKDDQEAEIVPSRRQDYVGSRLESSHASKPATAARLVPEGPSASGVHSRLSSRQMAPEAGLSASQLGGTLADRSDLHRVASQQMSVSGTPTGRVSGHGSDTGVQVVDMRGGQPRLVAYRQLNNSEKEAALADLLVKSALSSALDKTEKKLIASQGERGESEVGGTQQLLDMAHAVRSYLEKQQTRANKHSGLAKAVKENERATPSPVRTLPSILHADDRTSTLPKHDVDVAHTSRSPAVGQGQVKVTGGQEEVSVPLSYRPVRGSKQLAGTRPAAVLTLPHALSIIRDDSDLLVVTPPPLPPVTSVTLSDMGQVGDTGVTDQATRGKKTRDITYVTLSDMGQVGDFGDTDQATRDEETGDVTYVTPGDMSQVGDTGGTDQATRDDETKDIHRLLGRNDGDHTDNLHDALPDDNLPEVDDGGMIVGFSQSHVNGLQEVDVEEEESGRPVSASVDSISSITSMPTHALRQVSSAGDVHSASIVDNRVSPSQGQENVAESAQSHKSIRSRSKQLEPLSGTVVTDNLASDARTSEADNVRASASISRAGWVGQGREAELVEMLAEQARAIAHAILSQPRSGEDFTRDLQSAIAEFVSQPVQSGVDESGDDAGYKHLMLEALNDAVSSIGHSLLPADAQVSDELVSALLSQDVDPRDITVTTSDTGVPQVVLSPVQPPTVTVTSVEPTPEPHPPFAKSKVSKNVNFGKRTAPVLSKKDLKKLTSTPSGQQATASNKLPVSSVTDSQSKQQAATSDNTSTDIKPSNDAKIDTGSDVAASVAASSVPVKQVNEGVRTRVTVLVPPVTAPVTDMVKPLLDPVTAVSKPKKKSKLDPIEQLLKSDDVKEMKKLPPVASADTGKKKKSKKGEKKASLTENALDAATNVDTAADVPSKTKKKKKKEKEDFIVGKVEDKKELESLYGNQGNQLIKEEAPAVKKPAAGSKPVLEGGKPVVEGGKKKKKLKKKSKKQDTSSESEDSADEDSNKKAANSPVVAEMTRITEKKEEDRQSRQSRASSGPAPSVEREISFVYVEEEFPVELLEKAKKPPPPKPAAVRPPEPVENTKPAAAESDKEDDEDVHVTRDQRAAMRAAQAQKRRDEVERKRKEREEQIKREKEAAEREEQAKREFEEEMRRREQEKRRLREEAEEERRRLEMEETERERRKQAEEEREKRRKEEYKRKLEEMRRKQAEEDRKRKELEEQQRLEEEERQRQQAEMLARLSEIERQEFEQRRREEEEAKRRLEEERRLRQEEEARLAMEEAKRLAIEMAQQKAELERRLQFNRSLHLEASGLQHTHNITRAFTWSYFELLRLLGLEIPEIEHIKRAFGLSTHSVEHS